MSLELDSLCHLTYLIEFLLLLYICVSPVSNDGRGLKPVVAGYRVVLAVVSPVSNDGRGLKHLLRRAGADRRGRLARQQ